MADAIIYGCTLKQLPESMLEMAAAAAIDINPTNEPIIEDSTLAAARLNLTPGHLAVFTQKRWRTPVRRGVKFLDNPSQEFKNKLLAHANLWNKTADVLYAETTSDDGVRLARERGQGYFSFLGTDNNSVPRHQQTMNLDSFTVKTPDSEWMRVAPHEFGHDLGFNHEHSQPAIIALLDERKVIAIFGQEQGWSEREVRQQILTPPNPRSIWATRPDQHSIMCYSFSGRMTKNGQPIIGGSRINELDYEFAALVYPKPVVVEPPPQPPPTAGKLRFKAEIEGRKFKAVELEPE